ncbi:conjugal transfer protein TraI [Brevirhabdus pacifica]|uniref:Conjugal transfer protein TraI n=2 Tax=Brevirhabdus pacifica TaxID=1267768 RepID=A0A1U7DLQ9_9RHOB|nr:TrbI/VirB10 family protein [Brevirhabdus pacifica]APX90855.1 conjugal transfer protein TraI [Brevirhabdus pacifica]OWU79629.1 conjugal transfer protein TraI [Loktanella sp. 22II-4b]PJJ87253.1 type IV secretion system protein VirB10 [Brevirhabdus pacifica]
MTQNPDIQEPPRTEEEIAQELRLRPDPPRVMRLSRRAIALATAIGGLGLGAILIVALQNNRQEGTQTELFSTERIQAAEGLSTLPRDYADVPRLGPPLPGELGRAILGAQDRGQPVPAPPLSGPLAPTVDPEEQRRLQELDAARLSALFAEAQTVQRGGAQPTSTPPATGALFPSTLGSPTANDPVSNREAFLTRPGHTDTVSAQRITAPPSPYILQAGTVIPAALITGLRSDLPGQISAQVTSNVYDSPSGRYLLIPQGARLLGEYDSRIASGQSRLLLVWTRLILSDGRSIVLERAPGTDGTGASGLQDRVNYHWGRVFLAAGLATILNLGLEGGADSEDDVARAIREAAQDTIGRTGDEIVQQQLAVPPTLTIRPGFPVRVMVTRDLILEPLGEVR